MEQIAHQAVVMQFIMEMAKNCNVDPRGCFRLFFQKAKVSSYLVLLIKKVGCNWALFVLYISGSYLGNRLLNAVGILVKRNVQY